MEYKTPLSKRNNALKYYYDNYAITDDLSETEKKKRIILKTEKNRLRREKYNSNIEESKKNALRMRNYRLKKKEEKYELNNYLSNLWFNRNLQE